MANITYIEFDGTEHKVELENGTSIMEGAVWNSLPGIDGDCGGSCACATCHVYVDADWIDKTGKAGQGSEQAMLELADEVTENSRLGCQVKVSDELDGLIVRMPMGQH